MGRVQHTEHDVSEIENGHIGEVTRLPQGFFDAINEAKREAEEALLEEIPSQYRSRVKMKLRELLKFYK